MGAFVEHKFKSGFLLDEERLRKIHDIIEIRTSKFHAPLSPRYKVFRGDSYSYETSAIKDIIEEDNEDWRRITKIEIIVNKNEAFDFKLSFSNTGAILEITGDNRDAVFLLFSDLREFVKNEVTVVNSISKTSASLIGTILLFALLMGFMSHTIRTTFQDPTLAVKALSSSNIEDKLNFLIEGKRRSNIGWSVMVWLGLIFSVALLSMSEILQKAWNTVFPSNIFLFGKIKTKFEKRRKLLGNIFWVVIVGLVVSAAAGLVVWKVTSG